MVGNERTVNVTSIVLVTFVKTFLKLETALATVLVSDILKYLVLIPGRLLGGRRGSARCPFTPFLALNDITTLFIARPLLG